MSMDLEAMEKRAVAISMDHGSYDHAGEMAGVVRLLIGEVERLKADIALYDKKLLETCNEADALKRERDEAREAAMRVVESVLSQCRSPQRKLTEYVTGYQDACDEILSRLRSKSVGRE